MRRRPKVDVGTTIHDFSFLMKVLMVLFLVIVITMINPAKEEKTSSPVAGDIAVEAHWADDANVDVDLWVRGPQDVMAVGYSRRSDQQFSYVRDDVGTRNDPTGANYEFSFSRGRAPGLYVINLHLYSSAGHPKPIRVRVVATAILDGTRTVLAHRDVDLLEDGEEQTVFSFELDAAGNIMPESMSQDLIPLRNAGARQ